MRKYLFVLTVIVLTLTLMVLISACATPATGPDALDIAIRDTSDYLNDNIPKGNKIVILNIQSDHAVLSEYIIDELIANAVNDKMFSIVDRAQLDQIRMELNFQLSGEVSDESALSIGRFLGAQTIVSGAISELAGRHRMRIRALNVQTAEVQGQYNCNINASKTLTALLKGGKTTAATYSGRTNSGTADTNSSGTTTATPAAIPNGTYTFWPPLRSIRGGIQYADYIQKIEVSGRYMIVYFTNNLNGDTGGFAAGLNDYSLQDIDRPQRRYTPINQGASEDRPRLWAVSFEGVQLSRFSITVNWRNPPIVWEEIDLDKAEYEP